MRTSSRGRVVDNHVLTRSFLVAALTTGLVACASAREVTPTPLEINRIPNRCDDASPTRNIAVFFDGTNNTETSATNIFQLRNLASLQPPRPDGCPINHSLYVEGVGTEGLVRRFVGLLTGAGIDEDVRQAYAFVARNYRGPQDHIYVFGFSRGAAAARILASFIYHAGLPTDRGASWSDGGGEIRTLYGAYATIQPSSTIKRDRLRRMAGESGVRDARIDFLGLFDTVPALGLWYFGKTDGRIPQRYSDQLCNVDRAVHALSIDDNREKSFFPSLLTNALLEECGGGDQRDINSFVDQVWFSGAHSDVGGGNFTDLSGVPLNWMIELLKEYDRESIRSIRRGAARSSLLGDGDGVFENPLGTSQDAAANFLLGWQNRNRSIPEYFKELGKEGGLGSACPVVHQSVIDRLEARDTRLSRDFDWIACNPPGPDEFATNYPQCFDVFDENGNVVELPPPGVRLPNRNEVTLKFNPDKPVIDGCPSSCCPTIWRQRRSDAAEAASGAIAPRQ